LWPRPDRALYRQWGHLSLLSLNRLRRDGLASKDCLSFRCDLLDDAIAEQVLKALQPAEIELALAALQEL
jgi:hypothetical protein